jgi:heptosyltransferase-2
VDQSTDADGSAAGSESVNAYCSASDAMVAINPLLGLQREVPRRILIVKVNGLGDAVLVRSIVEKIRHAHPEIQIGVLVDKATREVMTLGANFRVHHFNRLKSYSDALRTLYEIRQIGYDAILNFEQSFWKLSAALATTGVPLRYGFVQRPGSLPSMFLSHPICFEAKNSMWQSFLVLARHIEPSLDETFFALPFHSNPHNVRIVSDWWSENLGQRTPTVALHLGSYYMDFKRWPLERFVQFAELLRSKLPNLGLVLTGTPPEAPLIRDFISRYSGHAVDASELGSIGNVALMLARCDLLVSNDTGVMHLGAALGTPTVGLFGPVSPAHWAPVGERATYVYQTKLGCSPCVDIYANRRPSECANPDKSRCMRDIDASSVVAAAKAVIVDNWLT